MNTGMGTDSDDQLWQALNTDLPVRLCSTQGWGTRTGRYVSSSSSLGKWQPRGCCRRAGSRTSWSTHSQRTTSVMHDLFLNFGNIITVLKLKELLWLPTEQWIKYKRASLCYKVVAGSCLNSFTSIVSLVHLDWLTRSPRQTHPFTSIVSLVHLDCLTRSPRQTHSFTSTVSLVHLDSLSRSLCSPSNARTFCLPTLNRKQHEQRASSYSAKH